MTDMESTLTNFSGEQRDFAIFSQSILAKLKSASVLDPQVLGLLGFYLTPAEYLAEAREAGIVAAQFVPRPNPGPRPALAPGANQLAVSIHTLANNDFKQDLKDYRDEQMALSKAKMEIFAATPAKCVAVLKDPVTGFRNVTLRQYHEHMDMTYLIMSPADLADNFASLDLHYDETKPLSDFIASQREVHTIQLANNNPIAESRKVIALVRAMTPCGTFNTRIDLWKIEVPTVVLQTFDLLATALEEFDRNRSKTATTSGAGYSAAVHPSIASIQTQMATMTSTLAAVLAAQQKPQRGYTNTGGSGGGGSTSGGGSGGSGSGGGSGGGGSSGGGGRGARPGRGGGRGTGSRVGRWQYCWTHGAGGHKSAACTGKDIGHQDAASFANQLGGTPA